MHIWPGKPYPLGATYDGGGTNFSIFSEVAEMIELCLIGDEGTETRLPLPERDGLVWPRRATTSARPCPSAASTNQAYYRLVDGDPAYYYDTTGTGNSLNVRHHESLRLLMDSLRYWVTEMHVDGFRFDLASSLAREFWLRPDGRHMTDHDWTVGTARSVAVYLNGKGIPERDDLGEQIVDDSFLLMINAHHQQMSFTLPDESFGRAWQVVVDTADPLLANAKRRHPAPGGRVRAPARAMLVLRCRF